MTLPSYSIIDPLESIGICFDPGSVNVSTIPAENKSFPELPIELWSIILRAIDDHRALYACLCTCHVFNDLGNSILAGRQTMVFMDRGHRHTLARRLIHDPFLAHLLRTVIIRSSELPAFCIEFCGRLHNIRELQVLGIPGPRIALGTQSRLALTKFTSVTSLYLQDANFATFTEYVHLLCAFRNLRHLRVSSTCCSAENCNSVCVTQMPFAQGLNLEKMDIYMNAKCPISPLYIHLLLSPRLAETLNELVITVRDKCILDSVAFSTFNLRHRERHVELMSLQKLSVDIAMQETGTDQDHVLLDFLRILVATNLKSLRVFLSYGYCASVQFAHVGEEGNASCYLQELDDFFDSPQFPCLEKVSITLQSMCAEDFECVLAMPSHQLPFPALRRWELLILQVSERQNPLRFLQVIPPQGHK